MMTGLCNVGICSRCKLPKDLRKINPKWCVECYSDYQKEYRSKNGHSRKHYGKEKYAKFDRKYRTSNKGRISHKNTEYRRRKVYGKLKAHEWIALCILHGNICLKCKQKKPLTIDHINPISKGGTNTINNVQPLCIDCNIKKATKDVDYRGDLI